jgi:hypothetical protein
VLLLLQQTNYIQTCKGRTGQLYLTARVRANATSTKFQSISHDSGLISNVNAARIKFQLNPEMLFEHDLDVLDYKSLIGPLQSTKSLCNLNSNKQQC